MTDTLPVTSLLLSGIRRPVSDVKAGQQQGDNNTTAQWTNMNTEEPSYYRKNNYGSVV